MGSSLYKVHDSLTQKSLKNMKYAYKTPFAPSLECFFFRVPIFILRISQDSPAPLISSDYQDDEVHVSVKFQGNPKLSLHGCQDYILSRKEHIYQHL